MYTLSVCNVIMAAEASAEDMTAMHSFSYTVFSRLLHTYTQSVQIYPFLFIDRNARIARLVFGLSSTAAIAALSCVVTVFIVAIEHRA